MTDRSISDWLEYISSVHPVGWDFGLDRVLRVGRELELLHPSPITILVAGTNGKGSACEYLAQFASSNGLTVGKSTSPHLRRFNERIAINHIDASDAAICEAFEVIDFVRGETTLTYFEFAALASLYLFKAAAVDVAVLEIGLGGRLDAMNIVSPDICVITSIALDHQAYLGDTRDQIAREKAGIMRQNVPCIVVDRDPPPSILEHAAQQNTPLDIIGHDFDVGAAPPLQLPRDSYAAAHQVAIRLGWSVAQALTIAKNTALPGRRTWSRSVCPVLIDVAHNLAAAEDFALYLEQHQPEGQMHAVLGMYADKDIEAVTGALSHLMGSWHFTDMDEARAETADNLRHRAGITDHGVTHTYATIAAALAGVRRMAKHDDLIVVFGSFPVVAGALDLLEAIPQPTS